MSTKATAKQTDVAIQIDYEGTQFGIFNPNGDPIISHFTNRQLAGADTLSPLPDEWVLSYRDAAGQTNAHYLGIADVTAEGDAIVKAQEHLRGIGFTPATADLKQFGDEPEPTGW